MVISFIAAHPIDAYRESGPSHYCISAKLKPPVQPSIVKVWLEVRTVDLSGAIRKVRTFAPSRVGKGAGNKKQK